MSCKSIKKLQVKRKEGTDEHMGGKKKLSLRSKTRNDASSLHMQNYTRVTPNLKFHNGQGLSAAPHTDELKTRIRRLNQKMQWDR